MDIRVVTLRYIDGIQGFPEDALLKAVSGREVLDAREHFFVHGNVPHMAVVLLLGDTVTGRSRRPPGPDPGEDLPDERKGLYRALRTWRGFLPKHGAPRRVPAVLIPATLRVAMTDFRATVGMDQAAFYS